MAESKVYSIRADEETLTKFKEVTEQFPNASEAMRALLNAHEITQAKMVLAGQETSIDDFQAHADSLVRAYINSLDLTANAEQRIHTEYRERLDSKDKTISDLQKRLEDAKQSATEAAVVAKKVEQRAAERDAAATQQIAEYSAQAERAQKDKDQAEKNAQISESARLTAVEHLNSTKEQLEKERAAVKETEKRIEQLEAEVGRYKDELTKTQSALSDERIGRQADKSAAELALAQAEIACERAISAEKEKNSKDLLEKTEVIETLLRERADLREQLADLKARLNDSDLTDLVSV